jgi:hypothetical protein
MPEDRENENLEEATDPPDNQRSIEDGVSLDSTGGEANATDPPDNQRNG